MSSGSKPVTTIGTWYFFASGSYSVKPMIVQTWPAARNACTRLPSARRGWPPSPAAPARATPASRSSAPPTAPPGTPPSRWPGAVVSKPTAKNTTSRSGVLPRDLDGIERRIDDAHVAAASLHRQQVGVAAGHAQHVAEGAERHAGTRGDLDRLLDQLQRRHAHRASRAVHQRHLRRQQVVDAELDDGVRLPAAHLHQRPRPRRDARQRARELRGGFPIAVFVDELHSPPPSSSSLSSPMSFR